MEPPSAGYFISGFRIESGMTLFVKPYKSVYLYCFRLSFPVLYAVNDLSKIIYGFQRGNLLPLRVYKNRISADLPFGMI